MEQTTGFERLTTKARCNERTVLLVNKKQNEEGESRRWFMGIRSLPAATALRTDSELPVRERRVLASRAVL